MTSPSAETLVRSPDRARLSLDGLWDFRLEGRGGWRKARVPAPWQAEFDDLRDATGTGVYRRRFALPGEWRGREVALRFGAVGYFAEVAVNGRALGTHEGGYLPFEVVLPEDLLRAENEIELRATLPSADEDLYPDFPFPEIPHGKQSWYGMLGGPWQSVTLEARDPCHVRAFRLFPDAATGRVRVAATLAGRAGRLAVTLLDPSGAAVAQGAVDGPGETAELELTVPEALLWSPETPHLHVARLAVETEDGLADREEKPFGFRSFEARDGRFYLNGAPFYMRGALDQDYYPDAIATPPSTEFLEDQLRKAKALGLNLLRCHIKVPDPRYYEVADRLGMLVWTEIPNVETFTDASARRLKETMEGILARDGHHPSIIAWTLINEDWGMRLREAPEQRAWLADAYRWLKAADPQRLVVDNSPCAPNFHVATDINDFHYYRTVPERRAEWDMLTAEFAADADWAWSPFGDAERTGQEPRVVSEFGAWGLPLPDQLREGGRDPWWFAAGTLWGEGTAVAGGIEQRFRALALDTVFSSFEAFVDAAQWYQFENLKYQIESLRTEAPIAGYVITELSDVHWEANGLMDIGRNLRTFHQRFPEINADTVIVAGLDRWSWWAGETMTLPARIAAGGLAVPEGATLAWEVENHGLAGSVPVPPVAPLEVGAAEPIAIALPEAVAAEMLTVHLRLHAPGGAELARNRVTVALHPRRDPAGPGTTVACDDRAIELRLAELGYRIVPEAEASLFVTRKLDGPRTEAIRLGQHVLLLAEGETGRERIRLDPPPREPPAVTSYDAMPGIPSSPYFVFPGFGVKERNRTIWRGDWIGNFSWLKRSGPFAALPGGPMLDLSFDRVIPHSVLTGFRPWEYEGRIKAGVVVGWVHKPAAFLVEKSFGLGRLTATTFRLTEDPPGADPTATTLLDALIATAHRA